jgi:hypothetical protein
MNAGDVPVAGGTESLPSTPPEVAKAHKQLKALQWAIPGLTGAVLASSSLHEEQQRPTEFIKGTLMAAPARAAALGATAATVVGGAASGAYDKVSDKVKDAI